MLLRNADVVPISDMTGIIEFAGSEEAGTGLRNAFLLRVSNVCDSRYRSHGGSHK